MQGVAPAIGCPAGGSARIGHRLSLLGLWGRLVRSVRSVRRRSRRLVRWPASRWARSARRMIAQTRLVGWRAGSRCSARPPRWRPRWRTPRPGGPSLQLGRRPLPGGKGARVEGHKHRIRGDRALPDRFGVAGGHPQPCRWKALRSIGQVVPNSAAAALTLPSRSASARRVRPRSGRPGSGWAASPLAAGHAGPLVDVGEDSFSRVDAYAGCQSSDAGRSGSSRRSIRRRFDWLQVL
jgi:hypothetical protein